MISILKRIVLCLLLFLMTLLSGESVYAGPSFNRVVIDAGHGGRDKGAHVGRLYEKNLALDVAVRLEKYLQAKEMPVIMTRRSDRFISLPKRTRIANRYHDAIFVSIHFNSYYKSSVNGLETFYASGSRSGRSLAYRVQRSMLERIKAKNRKHKSNGKYYVLMNTNCTAILVECGFISNYWERKRAMDSKYRQTIAEAIGEGILWYHRDKAKGRAY